MPFYSLEPEVAGELGADTIMDTQQHPPRVRRLHYSFTGWLGDDILESFPCYIVTERLANAIRQAELTGLALAGAKFTQSLQFDELYPRKKLPHFLWLQVVGVSGEDDFGMGEDHRVVVSGRALTVLRAFSLANCDIEEWGRS